MPIDAQLPPSAAPGPDEPVTIILDNGDLANSVSGEALRVEIDDGSVIIDLNPTAQPISSEDLPFDVNLANHISAGELSRIASMLGDAIAADDMSRQEWLETRAAGIEMLGFKIETPQTDSGTSPLEGMSTVRNPLLSEAVIRFQSNASGELYPAEGPVKVRDDTIERPANLPPQMGDNGGPPLDGSDMGFTTSDLAEALEKDLNHYLTKTDKGYRQDCVRMLFWVGFGGCAFRKVYNDPIRQMPISRSVDAADLIVSNDANDIDDAGRVTHRIKMRKSTLRRMQIAGVYRDVAIYNTPYSQINPVDEKIAEVQGFNPQPQRPEDYQYTIYECYCELDIAGYEDRDEEGNPTGLQIPYRVVMEKESRTILEIRRNWREDDVTKLAKQVFVKFPFVPTMGFYDTGLLQILGNSNKALTGAWRIMLDSGMFSCFPGFLYADTAGRQVTNEFRVPPGGGVKIQTGGKSIQEVVMALPYKDISQGLMLLAKAIEEAGQRVGGTAELQIAEGRQDAPVGTTLAMIEQATKMLAAVHINLHAAQSEEFQLLKECFRQDPEAFWRHNKRPATSWSREVFLEALENSDLVPAADPNTPSHMHRIMKAMAIVQMATTAPGLFDPKAVAIRAMRMFGIADPMALFNNNPQAGQPQQPPPDPVKMAQLQQKQQQMAQSLQEKDSDRQERMQQTAMDAESKRDAAATASADAAAERASKERQAEMDRQTEGLKLITSLAQSGHIDPSIALAAASPGLGQAGMGAPNL